LNSNAPIGSRLKISGNAYATADSGQKRQDYQAESIYHSQDFSMDNLVRNSLQTKVA